MSIRNYVLTGLAGFVLVVAHAGLAAAEELSVEQVANDHIAAVGGMDAIKNIKTMSRAGSAAVEGEFGNFQGTFTEIYDLAGERGYQMMDLIVFQRETGWADGKGWQQSPIEGLKDLSEEEMKMTAVQSAPSLIAAIKAEQGVEAFADAEEAEFNETETIKLTMADNPLEIYVNKESKLIEGIAVGEEVEITMGGYEETEGVKLPGEVTMVVGGGRIKIVNTYEETEFNKEVDESKFAKPEVPEPAGAESESEPAATP